MAKLTCPKCGRETTDQAVFCPGCDFILDASFLGDDIMDVEADRRVKPASTKKRGGQSKGRGKGKGKSKPARQPTLPASPLEASDPWGAEALIVGNLDDDEVQSFQTNDTGMAKREVTFARMYVGGSIQAILMPDAVPEVVPDVALDSVRLTPFERHLVELVNGKRPVARLRVKSGLSPDDFQTALVLLADKGFIRLKGHAKPAGGRVPLVAEAEATAVAVAPSAAELSLDDADERASGFTSSKEATAPQLEDASSGIHRERTLIQPAPPPDDGPENHDDELAGGSFADSLLEEDSVFASSEDVAPVKAAEPRPPKARRRPPLPGELAPAELPAEAAAEPAPPPRVPPPPLPPPSGEGAAEAVSPAAAEEEVASFEEDTVMPAGPVSVGPDDISLVELEPEVAPVPPVLAPPPNTDPERVVSGIEVSDFSAEKQARAAAPPPSLPGKAAPPALPGAAAAEKGAAAAEPESASGEGVPEGEVSFEMLRKAEKIFEQAERDHAAGNVSSAVMNVKLALIYNPTEKRYHRFLADWEGQKNAPSNKASREAYLVTQSQVAEQKGEYEQAATLLKEALGLSPKAASIHNRLGVLLATRLKRYKEAANHVLTAIDLSPSNLAYKNNLGKILAKEESALHKLPMSKQAHDDGKGTVRVKKIRPKLF